ncbi:MAG: redoxin domain-containing protein [Candidatus Rokubacteria bacterium]|nr:redoxin domain-containing protein [Candidatus Rokubacteria bacterium]
MRSRRAALVALALLALVAPALAADRDTPLAVGDRAPVLELGDQHGAVFRLADALAANRYVVLAFYPKAFTGG